MEFLFNADISDESDNGNTQDASSTSMTCCSNELLKPLFNTSTGLSVIICPLGYSFIRNF